MHLNSILQSHTTSLEFNYMSLRLLIHLILFQDGFLQCLILQDWVGLWIFFHIHFESSHNINCHSKWHDFTTCSYLLAKSTKAYMFTACIKIAKNGPKWEMPAEIYYFETNLMSKDCYAISIGQQLAPLGGSTQNGWYDFFNFRPNDGPWRVLRLCSFKKFLKVVSEKIDSMHACSHVSLARQGASVSSGLNRNWSYDFFRFAGKQ